MPASTAFHMAKAHAHHSGSPSAMQINQMVTSPKIADVESILQSTVYKDIVDEIRPSVDLADFEIALWRNYASLMHLYYRSSPKDVKQMMEAYMMTIEAENINLILQAIMRDNVTETLEQNIIPIGKFGMRHYQRMMNVTKVDAATDFIIYPELRKAAVRGLSRSDNPDEQIFYISSELSHASFSLLKSIVPNWIKLEIDFLNLETICRAIQLNIDPKPWMIPNRGAVDKFIGPLSGMKTPREVISFMLPHFPITSPLHLALQADDNKVVTKLEDEVLSYLYNQHYRRFMVHGNRKEAILDFFAIKRAEIEDISRILFSVSKGIPAEQVREMLYPIYKR